MFLNRSDAIYKLATICEAGIYDIFTKLLSDRSSTCMF